MIEDLKEGGRYRRYSPLTAKTGLFRTFAVTPPSRQSVIGFASSYGLLGVDVHYRTFDDDPPYDMGGNAEPFDRWRDAITAMKASVDLWDLLRKSRIADERLERMVLAWTHNAQPVDEPRLPPVVGQRHPPGSLQDDDDQAFERFEESLERKEWRPAGWFMLHQVIGGNLKRHTAPSSPLKPDWSGLGLLIAPKNLLGALWLQLAQAVSGNLHHRICQEETCGQWFEVSTRDEGKRKNREYCSGACRQKTYRRRKRQAQTLAADGHTIEAIAQQLDSDLATVRKWVRI